VEIWEEEKGMETILPPQNKIIQDSDEMKKTDTHIHTPTKQR
jgi:hypothetical protein